MAEDASVTIKSGRDFDATWFVAKGSPEEIKQQVISYFGLTGDELADKTPHEVVLEGQGIAQGTASVVSKLNGSVEVDWPSNADKPAAAKKPWSGKKSAPKEEEKDENPFGQVLAQIEQATTEDALKKIWALNKEAFNDDSVKAASKAKFANLKENN